MFCFFILPLAFLLLFFFPVFYPYFFSSSDSLSFSFASFCIFFSYFFIFCSSLLFSCAISTSVFSCLGSSFAISLIWRVDRGLNKASDTFWAPDKTFWDLHNSCCYKWVFLKASIISSSLSSFYFSAFGFALAVVFLFSMFSSKTTFWVYMLPGYSSILVWEISFLTVWVGFFYDFIFLYIAKLSSIYDFFDCEILCSLNNPSFG